MTATHARPLPATTAGHHCSLTPPHERACMRAEAKAELIRQARRCADHVTSLRRLFRGALGNPEDVVQNIFADVVERIEDGADAEFVKASFSRKGLLRRGISELRRYKSDRGLRKLLTTMFGATEVLPNEGWGWDSERAKSKGCTRTITTEGT